jgi:hypothetical protein
MLRWIGRQPQEHTYLRMDRGRQVVWRGSADTQPSMIAERLKKWTGHLAKVGLDTGSLTSWLYRLLKARMFSSCAWMRGVPQML